MLLSKIVSFVCVGYVMCAHFSIPKTRKSECLVNFIKKFVSHPLTLICDEDTFSLAKNLNAANIPLTTLGLSDNYVVFDSSGPVSFYVITVNMLSNLEKALKLQDWNPEAKYLVIVADLNAASLLEMFRRNNMLNVVTAFYNKTDGNVEFYTWYPYDKDFCGKEVHQSLIRGCDAKMVDPFANKIPRTFHRCKFIVGWPATPLSTAGSDEKLFLEAFGAKYNLSVE